MKMSDQGLLALEREEGKQSVAYPDPASPLAVACIKAGISFLNGGYKRLANWSSLSGSPWTIGIGHTGPEVHEGLVWSDRQISDVLRRDVVSREDSINRSVKVALDQGQFDALGSFSFNIGIGAFERSTLLELLNQGKYKEAAAQFAVWCIPDILKERRARETAMFLGAPVQPPKAAATLADVQRKLGITVDGIYGPQTRAAVEAFQRQRGLVVDGLVGPRTLAALGF